MAFLYLLRHAESLVNVSRTMSYQHVDEGLSERGAAQAQAVARYFADKPIQRVFSGPLLRARETAEPIAQATGAPLEIVEALRELNVGSLEGRSDSAAWAMHDRVLHAWHAGDWDAAFPNGENLHQVHARITAFLEHLTDQYVDHDLVVVGHGGIFCNVLPLVYALPGEASTWLDLGNTAVSIFRRDNPLSCEQWNGLQHLA